MFKYVHNNKGSALALVIIIFAVGMILGTALLRISLAETNFSQRQENTLQARYIARSGAESMAEYMMQDGVGRATDLVASIGSEGLTSEKTEFAGGDFEVTLEHMPGENAILINSVGVYNGVRQEQKIKLSPNEASLGLIGGTIIAKELISGGGNLNKFILDGTISTMVGGTIEPIVVNKVGEENIGEPISYFPEILEPHEVNSDWYYYDNAQLSDKLVTGNNVVMNINAENKNEGHVKDGITQKHIRSKGIDVGGGNSELNINVPNPLPAGDNSIKHHVHLYVDGPFDMGQGGVSVHRNAALYIYMMGDDDIVFRGSSAEFMNVVIMAPDSKVIIDSSNTLTLHGGIYAKEVQLFNHTTIKGVPAITGGLNVDTSVYGVSFSGYTWID